MSDYAVLKVNIETQETLFLMANALGTKTFRSDFSGAWTDKDHRVASTMLGLCAAKHNDFDKYKYSIDDLNESGDW